MTAAYSSRFLPPGPTVEGSYEDSSDSDGQEHMQCWTVLRPFCLAPVAVGADGSRSAARAAAISAAYRSRISFACLQNGMPCSPRVRSKRHRRPDPYRGSPASMRLHDSALFSRRARECRSPHSGGRAMAQSSQSRCSRRRRIECSTGSCTRRRQRRQPAWSTVVRGERLMSAGSICVCRGRVRSQGADSPWSCPIGGGCCRARRSRIVGVVRRALRESDHVVGRLKLQRDVDAPWWNCPNRRTSVGRSR